MRSKTDKTAKKTALSAEPSATPKKRGRPSKADIAAREAGVGSKPALAPDAPVTEKKKRGRPAKVKAETATPAAATAFKLMKAPAATKPIKLKKKERVAMEVWDATFSKISQLATMGALHVKVDGVEVAFAPESFQVNATSNGRPYHEADYEADRETERSIAQMAKVAPLDNPDEYAEAQDRWANHEPLPRI